MAQRLRATVRTQALVAQLSDDAFAVLPDRVDAREFLERVRLHVGKVLKYPLSALEDGAVALTDFGGTVGKAFPRMTEQLQTHC